MRYLVTGAAGFIGSHLTRNLLLSGAEVVAVDNFSDYYSLDLKRARESNLISPLGLNISRIDLADGEQVTKLLNSYVFDSVIHLAAQPGVRVPLSQHQRYISSNLTAYANLLTKVRENSIPNFLYASSSSVYGNSNDQLFSEQGSITDPLSFYGATKLTNEVLARSGRHESPTRTRGLRFFTVYGPWGRPDMAYFRIIASLLNGFEFPQYGNGSVLRDFTFVDDAINAVVKLNVQLSSEEEGHSDVVNIGGGHPYSLMDMIETLQNLVAKKVKTNLSPTNPNDVIRTCADSQLLKSLVGTSPATSLEEGLSEVVKWAQRQDVQSKLTAWCESVS
ncbi:UDP-glucuronate 4-epimerase [Candidatus Planktophila dulcis]|uniref:NAD-dependent epimerase/dehydratase family protein n=1 Tax=Candidatus Planktophila dulcis TaxID=1884914 RepID=UPI000BBF4A63|nr:NAD-dependent epimerase/dehydratase family protein [Candidatus Planktophila dulcis]ASY20716.1 UDP-glucuronate 4-epimerase [Candidatus Planktophila dulcis]